MPYLITYADGRTETIDVPDHELFDDPEDICPGCKVNVYRDECQCAEPTEHTIVVPQEILEIDRCDCGNGGVCHLCIHDFCSACWAELWIGCDCLIGPSLTHDFL